MCVIVAFNNNNKQVFNAPGSMFKLLTRQHRIRDRDVCVLLECHWLEARAAVVHASAFNFTLPGNNFYSSVPDASHFIGRKGAHFSKYSSTFSNNRASRPIFWLVMV